MAFLEETLKHHTERNKKFLEEAKQPTQEQIKKFWEWCGLAYNGYGNPTRERAESLLPIDLNNLFKYAVPKLQDIGHNINVTAFECKGFRVDISDTVFRQDAMSGYDPYRSTVATAESEDPALALFWAIWEVINDIES